MNERVLIVDDDISLLKGFQRMLTNEGYIADISQCATDTLRRLDEQEYDLILLDVVLLDVDGLTLLKHIRSRAPNTVFIVITGYPSVDTVVSSLRSGAFDYLIKPVKGEDLLQRIKSGLEYKKTRPPASADRPGEKNIRDSIAELKKQMEGIGHSVDGIREKMPRARDADWAEFLSSSLKAIDHSVHLGQGLISRLFEISTGAQDAALLETGTTPGRAPRKTILIVDDDETICKIIQDIISEERPNYTVEYCLSFDEALARLKERPVDLMLLDIHMRKNDLGMLRELKKYHMTEKTFLLTENTESEILKKALRNGIPGFIYKPFNIQELLNAVDAALRDRGDVGDKRDNR